MKHFPSLKSNEVAILLCDHRTGHVLDGDLQLQINDNQKIFCIFSSVEDAKVFAKKIISQNPIIECTIFDSNNNILANMHIHNQS